MKKQEEADAKDFEVVLPTVLERVHAAEDHAGGSEAAAAARLRVKYL